MAHAFSIIKGVRTGILEAKRALVLQRAEKQKIDMKNINVTTKISMITLLITVLQFIIKLVACLHPEYMYIQQVNLLLESIRTAITIIAFVYTCGYWPLF